MMLTENKTPAGEAVTADFRSRHTHLAGWLDLAGTGVAEAAPRIQRAHLQIADTVFNRLERIPPAQPVVRITRSMHHMISVISYTSVHYGGTGLSYFAQRLFGPSDSTGAGTAPAAGARSASYSQGY